MRENLYLNGCLEQQKIRRFSLSEKINTENMSHKKKHFHRVTSPDGHRECYKIIVF